MLAMNAPHAIMATLPIQIKPVAGAVHHAGTRKGKKPMTLDWTRNDLCRRQLANAEIHGCFWEEPCISPFLARSWSC
jgi:hypothetical protein